MCVGGWDGPDSGTVGYYGQTVINRLEAELVEAKEEADVARQGEKWEFERAEKAELLAEQRLIGAGQAEERAEKAEASTHDQLFHPDGEPRRKPGPCPHLERAENSEAQLRRVARNQGWFDPDGPTPLERADARIQELEAARDTALQEEARSQAEWRRMGLRIQELETALRGIRERFPDLRYHVNRALAGENDGTT